MKKFFSLLVFFSVLAYWTKAQTPTFTFECFCGYLMPADTNCDICNSTTQSRYFKGLLIRKNGTAFKWIEEPYTIIQNFDALTFKELIPNAEQIRIERTGTQYATIAGFRDSVECPCSGGSSITLIAGPGIVISGDTISAVDTSAFNEAWTISDNTDYELITNDTVYFVGGGATTVNFDSTTNTVTITTPAPDGSETIVTGGTGINVTGTGTTGSPYVVTNTGDLSATNEIQTISAGTSGADKTINLSLGGGAIVLRQSGGITISRTVDTLTINSPTAADGSETIVTGANGIVVTGTGTSGNPYIVKPPAGTNTQTLRYSGTTLVANSMITNDGSTVGINTAPSASYQLYIKQPASTTGLFVERNSSTAGVAIYHNGSATVQSVGGLNMLLTTAGGSIIFLQPGGGGGQSSQVLINPLNNVTSNLGNAGFVNATGTYSPSTAGGDFSMFRLGMTMNLSGAANQQCDGLRIVPTLTNVPNGFFGIYYVPTVQTFLYQPAGTSVASHLIGNLGVGSGTLTPGAKIQIVGNGATSGTYSLIVTNSGATTSTAALCIRDDSRVGIGTNAPARALHVEGEVRIADLITDPPTLLVGADADGDLNAVKLGSNISLSNDTLNVANQLQTLSNTSTSTTHTVTLSNSGGSVQLVEGTGILLSTTGTTLNGIVTISAITSASGGGIYGDGTAGSGNDTLPPGGSIVTLPGQYQPLQFNANTQSGQVWTALLVNAATCADDRFTKYLVGKSPDDSLEVYSYDCGVIMKETGGQYTIQTDRELILSADSIKATTLPQHSTLPYLIGLNSTDYLSKIKGTLNGSYIQWDSLNQVWALASAPTSGSSLSGSGSSGQATFWTGANTISGDNAFWWDNPNKRFGVGNSSPSAQIDVTKTALGTTQTTTAGLGLINTTAAAAGAQQISPAIRWTGAGWKTNATAASQSVEARAFVTPVQGTANPSGYLGIGTAVNGTWSDNQTVFATSGEVGIGTQTFTGKLNVNAGSALSPFPLNVYGAASAGGVVYAQISNTATATQTFFSLNEQADINTVRAGLRRYGSTHATLANQLDLVNLAGAPVTISTNGLVRLTVAADATVFSAAKFGAGYSSTTGINSTLQSVGSFAANFFETDAALTLDDTKYAAAYTGTTNVGWTIPAASTCPNRVYVLHHSGTAGTLTLSLAINKGNGATFNTLTAGQWAVIFSTGSTWRGYKITSL